MSSTRNNNTRENYKLEQNINSSFYNYTEYKHSSYGLAYNVAIPSLGIMPSHMPLNTLSHNPVDIETYLRGIGSTNLVDTQKEIVPDLKNIDIISFFDRIPMIIPEPLIVHKNQRPLIN